MDLTTPTAKLTRSAGTADIDDLGFGVAIRLSVPMPTDPRAKSAAMAYLRHTGLSVGPTDVDLPAEINRAFLDETVMSFARWRHAARMRVARDLLVDSAKFVSVARHVGYAHLPMFSAAFSRFHGVSPRKYQEREIQKVQPRKDDPQ